MEELCRIRLRAPLTNPRWSWGAVRNDGVVFLRVWQDEKIKRDGKWFMRITAYAEFASAPGNLGWQERLQRVDLIRDGALAYMVMCEAVDPRADPRSIRDFDKNEVFVGGRLLEHANDFWLELAGRSSVRDIS